MSAKKRSGSAKIPILAGRYLLLNFIGYRENLTRNFIIGNNNKIYLFVNIKRVKKRKINTRVIWVESYVNRVNQGKQMHASFNANRE